MQCVLTLIRTDAGTENVEIRAIQVALRLGHRDSMSGYRSVFIGRSTSNQTTIDVFDHCNGLYLVLHFPQICHNPGHNVPEPGVVFVYRGSYNFALHLVIVDVPFN